MSKYTYPLGMGVKLRDPRTGVEGHLTRLLFNQEGCVEAELEVVTDEPLGGKKIEHKIFQAQRLIAADGGDPGKFKGKSDVVLGKEYRDSQSKLQGHAAVIEFNEDMATRIYLKSVTIAVGGGQKLTYHTIDDYLLEDVETKEQPKDRTKKPSPAPQEIDPGLTR